MKLVKCDYCGKIVETEISKNITLSIYENDKYLNHVKIDVCSLCYDRFSHGQLPRNEQG